MRRGVVALSLVLVVAACGDDAAQTTAPSQFPTGSVRSWFDALEIADTAGALELTHQASMLVLIAAENDMANSETAALLRRGATEESAARYLATFKEGLQSRYGGSLAEISVDGFVELGEVYAAVAITGEGGATIITRRAPGGLWQVDLVGTLGPALVQQLRAMLEEAGDGDDGDAIRSAYRDEVVPALEAASTGDPENLGLASEIRVMKGLLGD